MQLHITRTGYLAHWHFSHMARQILFTCLTVLLFITVRSQTTLVEWNFEDQDSIADSGLAINVEKKITTNTNGAISYPSGSSDYSISCKQWDNGISLKYWQINLSSIGYKNLSLSSKQRSSTLGPRDFKLQYSLDSIVWFDAGKTILVKDNFTSGKVSSFSLPSGCDNQSIVYILWIENSNVSVDGSVIDGRGTSRIDDIFVKGCLMPVLTSSLSHSICSGSAVNYIPAGSGTVFDWSRTMVTGILEAETSGSGTISEVLTNTTFLPIEVNYSYNLNFDGCTNSQIVDVTVNPTPDLEVSPSSQVSCPNTSILSVSFSNPNELAGTNFFWEWTGVNSEKLTVIPSNGTTSPINASISNSAPETLLETSIRITASSAQGCSVNQLVAISVGDNLPPTFIDYSDTLTFCVADISVASSNGADDISEPRPDYYMLTHDDHSLDLDPAIFTDNCTQKDELVLHWQIDLYQNSIPIIGSGQPSSTVLAIVFPGSAENVVNHRITYWLEDKCGNITPAGQRAIVTICVHPRPHIGQNF
ncbi:MAG: hypothetical protein NTY07_04910 [Bacteroidia bacterium]|nr:hypothetical protein [Bacteroidia bacterium]